MKISNSWRNLLENRNLSREKVAEQLGISTEDVRALRRIIKIEKKPLGNFRETGIAAWDIHYPEHNKECIEILLDFTKDLQPDYFILGGDQLDLGCISVFNQGKLKLLENKRLKEEYDGFQRNILDRFEKVLPRKCRKLFMMGNHEDRVERLLECEPQYIGLIEIEKNLNLKKWKIIPNNEVFSIGNINFIHGCYTCKYHANKTLSVYGDNVFYGHVHNNQSFTQTTKIENQPQRATAVGCLCNKNPEWMRGRPNSWTHEFLHFSVFGDGNFSPHIETIINGRCKINGKIYKGSRQFYEEQ